MKKWNKLLLTTGSLLLSVLVANYMIKNNGIQQVTEKYTEPEQDLIKDIKKHDLNHMHTSNSTNATFDKINKDILTSKEPHLSASVSKAKNTIQQSLVGDMRVKITPISRHEWKDNNKVIKAEKVLVEIKSKENKISSSYYAFINSKNGRIIRTFSAPIFENKNLVGKNIFYID